MENKLGRLLLPGEVVHHRNEDKTDDDISNLELKTNVEHSREHANERAPSISETFCGSCGSKIDLKPHVLRLRLSRNKKGKIFCSRSCGAKSSDTPAPPPPT